jgi:hypothetical protein
MFQPISASAPETAHTTGNFLSRVQTGYTQVGQRIVIAGVEKVGKTTLSSGAPNALLVPLEQGSAAIPVAKLPQVTTWEEIEALCLELIEGAKSGFIKRGQSVVWDSATALERAIHSYVIRTDPDYTKKNGKGITMESAHGGYGKAYNMANELFERWTRYMDELAFNGGINIIITCHVFASRVVDPAHGEYDTWDLLLHSPKNNKTYGKREFMTQWADLIGFFHEPMFVMKAAQEGGFQQGISANQGRLLAVDRQPAWVAGNRYNITGKIPIPAPMPGQIAAESWNALASAIWDATQGGIDIWNRGNGNG